MRYITLLLISILLSNALLNAQVDKAIEAFTNDTVFRNAGISICIRDVDSGEILAAYNENMALTSASVMKLVTTGTILELLGPNKVFGTKLWRAGTLDNGRLRGYLVIEGGGDPALGSEYFEEEYKDFLDRWVLSVKEAGIKHIEGRVMAETYIFSSEPVAPGWSWSDIGNYYGAGVHGLNVFDNMYRIFFRTGPEGSRPEILGVNPEIPGLEIESTLIARGNRDNGYVYLEPYGKHAKIRGTIPANRDTFALKASIPDPPLLLATMLHQKLTDSGITISQAPSTSREMPGYMTDSLMSTLERFYFEVSPSLDEIINKTNLESINLFAETLAWTLDNQINQRINANLDGGLQVINDFLESKDISQGLYMTDGSGLSRSNAMSSSFITNFLTYMERDSRYSETFINSLATPGEGTLESYFLAPELKGNLVAKSGTVTRVRNYAGYLKAKSGRKISFGVLTNNFDCSSHQVSKRVEKLMQEVYLSY